MPLPNGHSDRPSCTPDIADHSHEIGIGNLPFTRRGRKAAAEAQARNRARTRGAAEGDGDEDEDELSPPPSPPPGPASSSSISGQMNGGAQDQQQQQPQIAHIPPQTFQSAMMAIAPHQQQQQTPTHGQPMQPLHAQQPVHMGVDSPQDRWERMSVLFQNIRNNARTYNFSDPSVVALESVLIRLYLESPMNGGE